MSYKEKIHILDKKFWIKSYENIVDDNLAVEVGIGNNKIVPKPEESLAAFRLSNTGNLNLSVRFTKRNSTYNSNNKKRVKLGPDEEFDGVEIIFQGRDAPNHLLESTFYASKMIMGYFEQSGLIISQEEENDYG